MLKDSKNNEIGGRLAPSIHNGWVLNPETPFPLTVQGIDRSQAEQFKAMLSSMIEVGDHGPKDDIVDFVATSGLSCQELTEYISQAGPAWRTRLRGWSPIAAPRR